MVRFQKLPYKGNLWYHFYAVLLAWHHWGLCVGWGGGGGVGVWYVISVVSVLNYLPSQ